MLQVVTGRTSVVGVLGYPVAHSLSPTMHNAAFAALGLDWVYVPFEVKPEAIETAIAGLAALGVRGVNVTIPHKAAAAALADRLTPEAAAVGSVNTLMFTAEGRLGHSTDGPGFLRGLTDRGFQVKGARVVVLGTGGAARAVVGSLARAGAAGITVVARHPERGAEILDIARQLGGADARAAIVPWDAEARDLVRDAGLVVNATPIGMARHDADGMPVPPEWLRAGQWVYDLVYTPRDTTLLRAAAAKGCHTVDGLAMLVYQGAEAFTLWTGEPAPIAVMEEAVAARLSA